MATKQQTHMTDLATRAITPGDLDGMVELTRCSIGVEKAETFYQWKYFDNPLGQVMGRCAYQDGGLLASHSGMPVLLQAGKEAYHAIQLVDAMVVPTARRLGIFSRIAKETFEWMDSNRIVAAFVFPAPVTLQALTVKFGWTHVLDIPRFVRVLDARQSKSAVSNPLKRFLFGLWLATVQIYAGSRINRAEPASLQIEPISGYDERFDALWSRASCELKLATARTSTYLQWRYAAHPEKTYKCLGALFDDQLWAYVIFCHVKTQGIQTWELVELVVDPSMRIAGLALLHDLCDRAKQKGIGQLTTWALPHQRLYTGLLCEAGFVHTQSRFLPRRFRYTTPFVVRSHPDIMLSVLPFEAENWFLSMGDSDLH